MKIGIVCYPTVGGSGVIATELGHALASKGHKVHFITYEIPFRLNLENPNIFFHEVNIHNYDLFRYPDYALTLAVRIAEVVKEKELEILHVHYAIPHATSAFLAKQLLGNKCPAIITTLHGTDITLVGKDSAYFEIVKFSIEQSDGITSVSKNLREETKRYFGIKKPIEVIYNFFSPENECLSGDGSSIQSLRSHFVKKDEKLLYHSSNFRAVKRVEDVIRVFNEVHKKIRSKLLLLGSGPSMQAVKKMTKDLKLENEVIFCENKVHIDPYVASCDLLLLPSEQESFGLVAIEAMFYGLPVIATHVGGLPEVVEDGKTGYLSAVGDVGAMAKHAIELLTNQTLYNKMSQSAKKRVKKKFSSNLIVSQYEAFYEKTINTRQLEP